MGDNTSDGVSMYAFDKNQVVTLNEDMTDLKNLARQRARERGCLCADDELGIEVRWNPPAIIHIFDHRNPNCPLRTTRPNRAARRRKP